MAHVACADPECDFVAYHDFDSDRPHGDRYAHSLLDLIPERAWDHESKPRASEPCPLGFDCPAHQPDPGTVSTGGTGLWVSPARPAG